MVKIKTVIILKESSVNWSYLTVFIDIIVGGKGIEIIAMTILIKHCLKSTI